MENQRYVNIKKVSEYTSLPVKSLYELPGTGRIPSIKPGCRVLFDLQDIDKIMNSFKRSSNQFEMTANNIIGDLLGTVYINPSDIQAHSDLMREG